MKLRVFIKELERRTHGGRDDHVEVKDKNGRIIVGTSEMMKSEYNEALVLAYGIPHLRVNFEGESDVSRYQEPRRRYEPCNKCTGDHHPYSGCD